VVAALLGARSCKGKGPKQPLQKGLDRRINLPQRGQEQGHSLRTSMCFYHAKFGEQAKYCRRGASGQKTRPGYSSGSSPRSPLLRNRQPLSTPFPRRHRLSILHHTMAVGSSVLGRLPFAFVYLDDILMASSDEAAHQQHLAAVFTVLQQNGLIVKPDNCLFGCESVDFLGHLLSATSIGSLPFRVQAVAKFPRLATV
jgi:hypothetical protein